MAILQVCVPGPIEPTQLAHAAVLILFAGIFDMVDGRFARLVGRESELGVQLDSLADLVGFGVAPAVLAYTWKLHLMGSWGMFVAVAFVACAALRLARFNVEGSGEGWDYRGHSRGLTSTMAGGSLAILVWVSNDLLLDRLLLSSFALSAVMCTLSVLMISAVPFRNFRDARNNRNARGLLAVFLAMTLGGMVVVEPAVGWGIGALLYIVLGGLEGLAIRVRRVLGDARRRSP
jgi:CDP-diacylglycerol--serine O-phosphatidyltransferase